MKITKLVALSNYQEKNSFICLILLLIIISCKDERKAVLLADREAPIGWIYLEMFDDKTFNFISKGGLRGDDIYSGNFNIKSDTVYFKYKDSIPQVGSKAIIQKGYVSYINGSYPESVQIKLNILQEY
ncbi:hypothetical protein [Chryseobacterium luquanense]|uniref:DUF4369 domain-containing protein n=1 Tax=Chryseobacterium luquanense TaxID=2983766 RepID=A0ABT3XZB8_9FLAO|nr:hypothetical protein [Chryseobacterium luquanense]MCX8531253.1 hypothetical protein [Chryseobacterium luquanense]